MSRGLGDVYKRQGSMPIDSRTVQFQTVSYTHLTLPTKLEV
ncbi:hypothetical protein JMUB7533_26990 [Staphylococcus aureus]